jgi:hypothetical protein
MVTTPKPKPVYPIPEKAELLQAWHELDKPEIPLGRGCDVHDLPKFLDYCEAYGFGSELDRIREFLLAEADHAD